MREAIRLKLQNDIPELIGGIYEPHAAGPDTKKPFAVVFQGEDSEDSPWLGFRRIIEVWPYISQTSFESVDELERKIVAALVTHPLVSPAGVFSCIYLGSAGSDYFDKEWDALSRGLRFAIVAMQPVDVPEPITDDPWMDALSTWTTDVLGATWNVYRGVWPLGYSRPCVLWRLSDYEVRTVSAAAMEVRKQWVIHVLGQTANEQQTAVLQLIERLLQDIKLPLNQAERRYVKVVSPKADLKADAVERGQISVTLTRLTARPTEEAPLMRQVIFNHE